MCVCVCVTFYIVHKYYNEPNKRARVELHKDSSILGKSANLYAK